MDAGKGFAGMLPGFDFIQGLMKSAGNAVPGAGPWIAPTLDPQELDKRISELRTVQFWLEQNARMIGSTVQALEVQRMTLNTLQSMNVPMADLTKAFSAHMPGFGAMDASSASSARPAEPAAAAPAPPEDGPWARAGQAPSTATADAQAAPAGPAEPGAGADPAAKGVVDPMQWWGTLTQQFADIASRALHDAGAAAGGAPASRAAAGGRRAKASAKGTAARTSSAKSASAKGAKRRPAGR
jgi:hypothetical protein